MLWSIQDVHNLLPYLESINIYIAGSEAGKRDFGYYVKNPCLLQTCSVTEFQHISGTDICVEQNDQTAVIYFVPHYLFEEPATYSLSMAFQIFRKIDQFNLPYALVCVDNTVVNLYDSTTHSKFICTQLMEDDLYCYEGIKKLVGCKIPHDNDSEYHREKDYEFTFCNVRNHFENFEEQVVCNCVLCVRNPPSLRNLSQTLQKKWLLGVDKISAQNM